MAGACASPASRAAPPVRSPRTAPGSASPSSSNRRLMRLPAPGSLLAAALVLLATHAFAGPLPGAPPFDVPASGLGSVAADDDGSAFLLNPAAGGIRHQGELRFT